MIKVHFVSASSHVFLLQKLQFKKHFFITCLCKFSFDSSAGNSRSFKFIVDINRWIGSASVDHLNLVFVKFPLLV